MKRKYRIKHTKRFTNTDRGNVTVEAAIFLPLFILGILTIAYLIKFIALQESIVHSYTDEARKLASEAYVLKKAPLFELKLKNRILEENPIDIYDVNLRDFDYLHTRWGISGLITMKLDYKVKIRLPIQFYKDLPVTETLVFRGFIGADEDAPPMPFEEMEKEVESHLVWIFPRAGGRYHQERCIYISSEPHEALMSNKIRRSYKPCSICKPYEVSNGNLIYYFVKSGEVYHSSSCPTVDKYVISIEKEKAEEKGYTPCKKCGG